MRTLVVGMQSSGASFVTACLAAPNDVAVVDLFAPCHVPLELGDLPNVILKCVITNVVYLDEQIERFKPEYTVLVTRHPSDVRASLSRKPYANLCGTIEEKMSVYFDLLAGQKRFNRVVAYDAYVGMTPARSKDDIMSWNYARSLWCAREYGYAWGFGGWK